MMRVAILLFVVMLSGCEQKTQPTCGHFSSGDYVKLKISGNKGMILAASHYGSCWYTVRIYAGTNKTNTHLFSRDGHIEQLPVATLHNVQGFELERWE